MYCSLTFQSLLKASILALSLSSVSSSPLDIPSEFINAAFPSILESRQGADLAPPPNFGSEIINYTNENGTNSSIIHYSGVDISVDTGLNFHLTPPLVTALQVPKNFCTIANLSSTTTNIKKRLVPDFAPDGSIIIQPEDILDFEVDINECFRGRIFFGLGQALRDGTLALFPTTDQAKKLVAAVNNSFNSLLDDIVSYFDNIPGLENLQQIQRRAAAVIAIANELGVSLGDLQNGWEGDKIQMPGTDWYMSGNNTKLPCPDPSNFVNEHLVCQTTACNGDPETGICQSLQYQGCRCIPRAYASPPQTYDENLIIQQAAEFLAVTQDTNSPGATNLTCNGLGTPFFMPRDTAVSEIQISNFCYSGISTGIIDLGHNSVEDRVLNFTVVRTPTSVDRQPVTADQCNALLLQILDNCDGNSPDNPGNYKHGGFITFQGWAIYLTAMKRVDPWCNSANTNPSPTKWVSRDNAIQASTDLCNQLGVLNGKRGTRFSNPANQGKNTAVTVSILFAGPQDTPITIDECIKQMTVPIDGCDGNNPANPDNLKYGGFYVTDYGMVINVTPQVAPPLFPPNELDVTGHPIQVQCGVAQPAPVGIATIADAIKQYCVDGNFLGSLGSMKQEHGSNYVHLGGRALSITSSGDDSPSEADAAYQQGSPVCEFHDAWQGKIIAGDCTTALEKMANDGACFGSGGILTHDIIYTYRCVRWTITASSSP